MDYDEFEEDNDKELPKRTDSIYSKIEDFKDYELTHCIVYEMAVRNKDVKKIIHTLQSIKLVQDSNKKILFKSIEELLTRNENTIEIENKEKEQLHKKYNEYQTIYSDLSKTLINKYYIYFDQNAVYIPEIENPFKQDLKGAELDEFKEEISDALRSPIIKHISGSIGKLLHGEEYPFYKSDHNIYSGFVTARGIHPRGNTFNISSINTHFQRKIYDVNQINVALNMSLSEDELVAYIKHIKRTLSNIDSKKLKSPNKLLGNNVEEAQKTANFPKKPSATKFADMFFVYDYVTAKLKEHEYSEQLMNNEYKENKDRIKNSSDSSKDKKIQLQSLQKEYEENKVIKKIEDIFKDFDEPIEGIDFKSSTASNYYYALKSYIEECRYPEFLTGESLIVEKEVKKVEEIPLSE